jgi:hypothetical protein
LETDDVTSHIKSDFDLIREASELFGSFFGFEDDELASTIVKLGKNCASLSDLKKRIHEVLCFSYVFYRMSEKPYFCVFW